MKILKTLVMTMFLGVVSISGGCMLDETIDQSNPVYVMRPGYGCGYWAQGVWFPKITDKKETCERINK